MHRSNIIANIRGPFRLFLTLLVLVVLTGGQWTANASAPNPESDETPVDLAAMVLRGSDLEAEGFPEYGETRLSRDNKPWSYVPTGSMTLPEAVDLSVTDETPKAEIGQLYLDLEATGWQRQFRSLLTTQQSAVDQVIASSVGIYADASGAGDAFQLLTETSGRPDVEEIELRRSRSETSRSFPRTPPRYFRATTIALSSPSASTTSLRVFRCLPSFPARKIRNRSLRSRSDWLSGSNASAPVISSGSSACTSP